MSEDKFYFTSGELAKMSGASYKTIRHYVDKGLLKPEQITEHGYKMFGKKSVEDLQKYYSKVKVLKHDNNLLVPDVDAIFNYLASLPGNINTIVVKNEHRLKEYLKKKISEEHPYFIQKATGVIIGVCTK